MNGTQLWTAVRREFKKQYPTGTIHRVENTLERGMADVVWGVNGEMGWIELKGEGDKETRLQQSFRKKWNRAGCNAVVLLVDDIWFVVDDRANGSVWFETLAEAITCIVGG